VSHCLARSPQKNVGEREALKYQVAGQIVRVADAGDGSGERAEQRYQLLRTEEGIREESPDDRNYGDVRSLNSVADPL